MYGLHNGKESRDTESHYVATGYEQRMALDSCCNDPVTGDRDRCGDMQQSVEVRTTGGLVPGAVTTIETSFAENEGGTFVKGARESTP